MIVGFTGTRGGMTQSQKETVVELLQRPASDPCGGFFVHGDCLGADGDAHDIAFRLGKVIHIRPCDWPKMRSNSEGATVEHRATKALDRNRAIVDECALLIACPPAMHELPRGGTWYTIRYARKVGRRVVIVWPDGTTSGP